MIRQTNIAIGILNNNYLLSCKAAIERMLQKTTTRRPGIEKTLFMDGY
jgi:hypothetical protein